MNKNEFFKQYDKEIDIVYQSNYLKEKLIRFIKLTNSKVIRQRKFGENDFYIDGQFMFDIWQTYGFPPDLTIECLSNYMNGSDIKTNS